LNAVTQSTLANNPDAESYDVGGNSVTITVRNPLNGTTILTQAQPVFRTDPSNLASDPVTYPGNDPRYFARPGAGPITPAIPFGMAFFRIRLDSSSPTSPQTPGRPLVVEVVQNIQQRVRNTANEVVRIQRVPRAARTGGRTEREILTYLQPQFMIANPIGVKGSLIDTRGAIADVVPAPGGAIANGIGPFINGETAKAQVVTDQFLLAGATPNATPTAGTQDPDRGTYQYSMALANGNLVQRYDLRPYLDARPGSGLTVGQLPVRNRQRGQRVINDPDFYLPVAAGAGYASHGSTGSTDQSGNVRNLRVLNRSLLNGLPKVRVARDDLLWRFWPATVPNAETDPTVNTRRVPNGMSPTGVINPLPWDQAPTESQPWKTSATVINTTGVVTGNANRSQDYPNIERDRIAALRGGADATAGPVSLPGRNLFGPVNNAFQPANSPITMSVNVRVPQHQPANLAAIGNVTSTYVAPNPNDLPTATGGTASAALLTGQIGPVQLPRTLGSRVIRANDGATNYETIVPWGYTTRLLVYVDSNGDGKYDPGALRQSTIAGVDPNNPDINRQSNIEEAFREFEVWVGVPVDIRMKTIESTWIWASSRTASASRTVCSATTSRSRRRRPPTPRCGSASARRRSPMPTRSSSRPSTSRTTATSTCTTCAPPCRPLCPRATASSARACSK
jgi:hypothetical protein